MQPPQLLVDVLESRLLLAAGVVDTSFRGEGFFTDAQMTAITDVAVQRDGKIVAVGYRNDALGANSNMIVSRFERNGTLDTSFGDGGRVTIDFGRSSVGRAVAIAGNGDIVIAGGVGGAGGGTLGADVAVARLNSSGTLDNAFSADGMAITDLGRAVNTPDVGVDVGIDANNRIVVAARNNSEEGGGWRLARYRSNGLLDNTFADGGIRSEAGGTLNAIEVLKDGRILAAGELDEACSGGMPACGASSATIIRYTAAGARDPRFGVGGVAANSFQGAGAEQVAFTDIDMQGNRIVAVGLSQTQSSAEVIVARFTRSGVRDNTFNPPASLLPDDRSVLRGSDVKLAVQPNNRIVIGMTSGTLIGADHHFAIVRLRSGGGLDDSFGGDGLTNIVFDDQLSTLHALALQRQTGRIILAGRAFDLAPGSPELASAAMAALEGFKKSAGPDRTAPRAILQTRNPETDGSTTEFTVRYIDNRNVDRATIDDDDIVVSGPNGFSQAAKLVSVSGSGDDVRAVYSIDAPGGSWDSADEGRYTITLQQHEVADQAGNFSRSKVLGRFRV
jgi:uncharacterized delta-60 repeat protein